MRDLTLKWILFDTVGVFYFFFAFCLLVSGMFAGNSDLHSEQKWCNDDMLRIEYLIPFRKPGCVLGKWLFSVPGGGQ